MSFWNKLKNKVSLNPSFVNKELTIGITTIKEGQAWYWDYRFHVYIRDWINVGPFKYIKADYPKDWVTYETFVKNVEEKRNYAEHKALWRYINRPTNHGEKPRVTLSSILDAHVAVHETIWGIILTVVLIALAVATIAGLTYLLMFLFHKVF